VFDRLEVLPGIREDEQKQERQCCAELLHFAIAARIFHLDQTGIIDRLGEVDLGCTCPKRTTPCGWTFCRKICTSHCRRCCRHYAAPMNKLCAPRKLQN